MLLRVSFIVTYYNEPLEMLEKCIQSILALPFFRGEKEILLIDDGSKIPAPEFDGVTVIRQENQGLSAARNKGLELAKGEYIQFIDADDYLFPNEYNVVLDMQMSIRPDVLVFDFTHDEPKKYSGAGIKPYRSGIEFLRKRNMHGSACCYMFRKSILGDLHFLPGIVHEDELFTPQLLLKAGLLLVVNVSPYYYRIRTGTITHQQEEACVKKRLDDTLFVLRQLDALRTNLRGEAQKAMCRRVSQLTMDYIYNVWRQIPDRKERHNRIAGLREAKLYPLPIHIYTCKYLIFALMSRVFGRLVV